MTRGRPSSCGGARYIVTRSLGLRGFVHTTGLEVKVEVEADMMWIEEVLRRDATRRGGMWARVYRVSVI